MFSYANSDADIQIFWKWDNISYFIKLNILILNFYEWKQYKYEKKDFHFSEVHIHFFPKLQSLFTKKVNVRFL